MLKSIEELISEANECFCEEGLYKCYILFNTTLLEVDLVSYTTVQMYDVTHTMSQKFGSIEELAYKSVIDTHNKILI